MLKKIRDKVDVPLEIGATYATKINSAGRFNVQRIALNKRGEQMTAWGVYESSPHLGVCPLGVDRIVHDTVLSDELEVCEHCGMI